MSDQDSGAEKIQARDESVEGLESVFETIDVGHRKGKKVTYPEPNGVEHVHEGLSVAFETVDETASLPEDYKKKAPAYDEDHKPSMADIYRTEDLVETEPEPNLDLSSSEETVQPVPEVDSELEELQADISTALGISMPKAQEIAPDHEALEAWYRDFDFGEHESLKERIRDYL